MISRRAQLKGQDQKVTSLTDDFTMRNFISVSPWASGITSLQTTGIAYFPSPFVKNPSFMQEKDYEPLTLDISLLEGSTEGTSHNPEPASDTIVAVEDVRHASETQGTIGQENIPSKKSRTIRFAE
jgi:hypothetical protein